MYSGPPSVHRLTPVLRYAISLLSGMISVVLATNISLIFMPISFFIVSVYL